MRQARPSVAGLVMVTVAALTLAGCTSDADPDPGPSPSASTSPSADPPSSADPVTLRFAIPRDQVLRPAFRELARTYSAATPGVQVETVRLPGRAPLVDELDTAAADVFVASNEQAPALVDAGLVQPVDGLLGDRGIAFGDSYQRLGLESFSADQALQCMPYDVSPLVVFYNPGLISFRRLVDPGGTPPTADTGWTWLQFAEAARQMSRNGVKGVYVAPRLDTLMALSRSAGVDVVDDPRSATTLTLADDTTRAVLEQVLAVARDPRLTPTLAQLDTLDGVDRFAAEKIGMILGTKALVPELRAKASFDFDVFPLPRLSRSRTVAGVSGYCVSSTTEQTDAAADFLEFAAGEEGSTILSETGAVVPAHLPTLNSPAFAQPGSSPASDQVFRNALERSSVVPFNPQWRALRRAVEPDLLRLFNEPVIDLDRLLPAIDERSASVLAPPDAEAGTG